MNDWDRVQVGSRGWSWGRFSRSRSSLKVGVIVRSRGQVSRLRVGSGWVGSQGRGQVSRSGSCLVASRGRVLGRGQVGIGSQGRGWIESRGWDLSLDLCFRSRVSILRLALESNTRSSPGSCPRSILGSGPDIDLGSGI
ncbi:hypothetical protein HAX54_025995 [Datura stramonium]|uniref:Uncharacterized protein n=1 Tax=Datura stramonium TaxID=4076 RepID=A0ABS8S6K3_DATST|nr:hypothetical protein [Datura stramonium]